MDKRFCILDGQLDFTDDSAGEEVPYLENTRITFAAMVEKARRHRLWLSGEGGERADFRNIKLVSRDLRWLLPGDPAGDFRGANFANAECRGVNLSFCDLRGANLVAADLGQANLLGADLRGANLQGAALTRANLWGAKVEGAAIHGAYLPPTAVIAMDWCDLPADLAVEMMRLAAAAHPRPERFDEWADGGRDPYDHSDYEPNESDPYAVAPVFPFRDRDSWRPLWKTHGPGPSPSPWGLMVRLLAAKCPPWDDSRFEAVRLGIKMDAIVDPRQVS